MKTPTKKPHTGQTDCECANCRAVRMEKLIEEGEVVRVEPTNQFADYLALQKAANKSKTVKPAPISPEKEVAVSVVMPSELTNDIRPQSLRMRRRGAHTEEQSPPTAGKLHLLTKESVEKVLDEIDNGTRPVPRNRDSTNYCLESRGRHYPPKYVLARAIKIQRVKLHCFRGGPRTNIQLQNLGYVIREHHCGNTCNFSA